MADTRTAKELEVITLLCEEAGIDPTHLLANEQCDLVEVARIIGGVRAARAAMNARKI